MRVLVTGHKGYIGTVLAPMLMQAGHDVHGLDSDLFERCTYGVMPPSVPEIRKDVRDVERDDVDGFDAVLHLAGLSNDPLGDLDEALTYEINHRASVRLAALCKEAGVRRFIFSSSCSNYGAGGGAGVLDEDAELKPVTAYGKSKVWVEQDVTPMADATFAPCFLRNATAYGVSPRLRFDLVLNNLVAWAVTTGKVHLKSDGSAWRPLVHVRDIAAAFLATLEAPEDAIRGKAFNVGVPGENYRIRQIASIVQRTVPASEVHFANGASTDARNYQIACGRLPAAVPTFRPGWTVQRGADECYRSFSTSRVTLTEFEGIRYKRIDHVRKLVEVGVLDDSLRHTGR